MALVPVTIPEWLRPWHSAGVWNLLVDEALAVPDVSALPLPAGQAVPSPVPTSGALSLALEEAGDVQAWPAAWQRLLAKSVPAPVLWTYHELGQDLSGSGWPARGTLFRRLLADLRLPRGTSVFWPTALPTHESGNAILTADRALFWAGVTRLRARVLVVFGPEGLSDMGLEAGAFPVYQQRIVNGKWVAAMPDISRLLTDETRLVSTLSFLQAVLTPFIPV